MQWTKEQLKEVEDLAGLFFTEEEIQTIVIAPGADDSFEKAVHRGRLKSEATVRKSIFDLARAGSGPAQTEAMKMIKEMKVTQAIKNI